MSDSDDDGGEGSNDATALPISIAKWVIPSATALFVVVGYIVQTAQEDLLGIGELSHSSASYINAAALFVRDLVSLPLDVFLGSTRSLLAHWPILCVIVAAIAILVASLRARRIPPITVWAAPLVLAVLFVTKFLAFDVPLTLVNNMVLGGDTEINSLIDRQFAGESRPRSNGPLLGFSMDRANRFAHTIVCSHLDRGVLAIHPEISSSGMGLGAHDCDPLDDQMRAAGPKAAFTIIVLLQIVIIAAAMQVVRTPGRSVPLIVFGLFALIYSLTVPYDYGKLLKSTTFEYGKLKLATGLKSNDGVDTGDAETNVVGLVLAQDDSETRLLHVNDMANRCPHSGGTRKSIKMLSLAPSEVVAIAQIESRDIFGWRYSSEPLCN